MISIFHPFRYATLTVLVPPDPPTIRPEIRDHRSSSSSRNGDHHRRQNKHHHHQQQPLLLPGSAEVHRSMEGDEVALVCESRGGKPAAEVNTFQDTFQKFG